MSEKKRSKDYGRRRLPVRRPVLKKTTSKKKKTTSGLKGGVGEVEMSRPDLIVGGDDTNLNPKTPNADKVSFILLILKNKVRAKKGRLN